MVYLKYVENVTPLSKSIGLLFLFCLPLLSILFLKTKRNDLARPVMGTIFLVGERAKRARHSQVCSIIDSRIGRGIGNACTGIMLKSIPFCTIRVA